MFPLKNCGCEKLHMLLLLRHKLKKQCLCEECKSTAAVCCWCSISTEGQAEHQKGQMKQKKGCKVSSKMLCHNVFVITFTVLTCQPKASVYC